MSCHRQQRVPIATRPCPAMMTNLALELAPVRVNLIDARREQLRTTLPIRRVVGPADIAALAVHLMTNTAVTGATFDIDGGQQSWRDRPRHHDHHRTGFFTCRGSSRWFRWGNRLAQLVTSRRGRFAREGRSRRLLDVHLHQLAPHARLCARLGGEIPGSWVSRHRCSHPGVPVRTRRRQRAPGGKGYGR